MTHHERNQKLYARLRAGDTAARNELIEANLPLVRYRAREHIDKCPDLAWLKHEFISAGDMALVLAADSMSGPEAAPIANVTAHLGTSIENAFKVVRDQSEIVGPKARTTQKRRKKARNARRRCLRGEGYCNSVNDCRHTEDCIRYAMRNGDGKRFNDDDVHNGHKRPAEEFDSETIAAPDETAERELRRMIDDCCESEHERAVVELRARGFVDAEIGDALGLSQPTVSRIRAKVEAAFDAMSLAISA